MSDVTSSAPGRPGANEATTGPPVLFLLLAGLCVVVALGCLAVGTFGANVAGYVTSSILTVLLVGAYRRVDLSRRLLAGYRARPGATRAIPVMLVVAFVVAGVHVWSIATAQAS